MSTCNTQATSVHVAADCATWPPADRERWIAVFDPASGSSRKPWVRQTQYQNAGVYSRYLACAARHGLPGEVHPDSLRAFIQECQAGGCSAITISGYCWAIWKVLRLIRPEARSGLQWLLDTCCTLDAVAKQTLKRGAHRKVDSADLIVAGERLIAEARELAGIGGDAVPALLKQRLEGLPLSFRPTWRAIQAFRDGLFLLVGAYAPERRRALATISIEQIDLKTCCIIFEPHQTKTKKRSIQLLPGFVVDLIVEWLWLWRAQYAPNHPMLWIAKGGQAATAETLYAAMVEATELTLGFKVTPHDFRDAAATLVVEEAPQRSRLASILLGHASETMTRNYTEQANQILASRALAATIGRTAKATARKVRAGTRSTVALHPRSRRKRRA
jgi:integrase